MIGIKEDASTVYVKLWSCTTCVTQLESQSASIKPDDSIQGSIKEVIECI